MIRKVTWFDNLSMMVLLLMPILWLYGNPNGWSYQVMIVIPLSILFFLFCIVSKREIIGPQDPLPYGLLGYFIYWGVMFFIFSFKLPLLIIQIYLSFFLFFATFQLESFIKKYKIFAFICIAFLFVQELSYRTTGVRLSGIFSFLPLHYEISMADFIENQSNSARSCSFFAEPAMFAQFLLPLLAIELFHDKGKRHNLYAIIIGIALLFLQSGNGLFGLTTILISAMIYFIREKNRNKWLIVVLFSAVIIFAGYYYINSEMGQSIMERQGELERNYQGGNRSGFVRIWRGYYVFGDFNILEKIFGCPDETKLLSHINTSDMSIYGGGAELYFNAVHRVLLNTGFIGLGFFIMIIIYLWRGNSFCGKVILATFIVLSFMSAIYMTHTMILFLVLAKNMKDKPIAVLNNIYK